MAIPADITLDACRRREPEALAELVRRHQRQLRAYVAAICADLEAVDDLAQEVFLRAFQAIDRLLGRRGLSGHWLLRAYGPALGNADRPRSAPL
jgi:DNA-directed RNA polymerase specialized sigma24 family protein